MKKLIIALLLISVLGVSSFFGYKYFDEVQKQEKEKNRVGKILQDSNGKSALTMIENLSKIKNSSFYEKGTLEKKIIEKILSQSDTKNVVKEFIFLEKQKDLLLSYKGFKDAYLKTYKLIFYSGEKLLKTHIETSIGFLEYFLESEKFDIKNHHKFLLDMYFSLKKKSDFKKYIENCIKKYPKNALYYYDYANFLWGFSSDKSKFQPEVLKYLKKSIELDPKNALYYANTAKILSQNIEMISNNFLIKKGMIGKDSSIWYDIKKIYGNIVLDSAKKALELDPENPYYNYLLGEIYFREIWSTYNYLPSGTITPINREFYDNDKNIPKVIKYIKKAYELDPDNDFYARNLVNVIYYFSMEQYIDLALDVSLDFLKKYPENTSVLNNIAVLITAYPSKKNLEIGLKFMKKAYSKDKYKLISIPTTSYKNFLYIASLAGDKESVIMLLKRLNSDLYKNILLYDMYIFGYAMKAIGREEIGNTLIGASVLNSGHSTLYSVKTYLANKKIYLKPENLKIISPIYGSMTNYHKNKVRITKVLDTLKKMLKEEIRSIPSNVRNIFEKQYNDGNT